ncbi:unnamed protein product, partial [Staurois parvus]
NCRFSAALSSRCQICPDRCPAVPPASAAHLCCQSVPRGCASQCRQSVPSSDASQCRLSVPIISVTYQCCILVPPICDTSSVPPISAHQCRLINVH